MLFRLTKTRSKIDEKSKVFDSNKAVYLICYNGREEDGIEDVLFYNCGCGIRRPYVMSAFVLYEDGRMDFWYEPKCRLSVSECVQRAREVFSGKVSAKSPYIVGEPPAKPVPLAG